MSLLAGVGSGRGQDPAIDPVTLTGGIGPSVQGQPLAAFYVRVDDPAAVLKKVEAPLGGRVVVPPVDVRGAARSRASLIRGSVIGIVRRTR